MCCEVLQWLLTGLCYGFDCTRGFPGEGPEVEVCVCACVCVGVCMCVCVCMCVVLVPDDSLVVGKRADIDSS